MPATSEPVSDWTFGPVSGPVCGGLGATALVLAYPFAAYPTWLPLLLACLGAACAIAVGWAHGTAIGNIGFRAVCWLTAGGWTTWTITAGWSWTTGGLLAGGVLATGCLAPLFAADTDRPVLGGLLRPALAGEWEDRINRICGIKDPGVRVVDVTKWASGTGYTLTGTFPEGSGYTWEVLRDNVRGLGGAARLPKGCLPHADEGDHQGAFILKVPTVYDLAGEILYPRDYSPLSVLDEHRIGDFPDKAAVMVEVRQSSGLVAGRKGGGKTNLMDLFTANLARCPDAIIWHVDLNGGGMSVPWFVPYVEEGLAAPVIDWVAADPDEALLMSRVALAITKDRKARYGKTSYKANSRLVPISAQLPEIIIEVDESAEVLGETAPYREMRENFTEVMRLGRAVGVNMVLSSLRVVGDHIPVQVRKNCALRIITKVEEDSELDYAFNYARGLRSRDLRFAGCAYFYRGDLADEVRQFKAYHLLPYQIGEIARATAGLRPTLDAAGRQVGARVYAERWKRLEDWLRRLNEDDDVTPVDEGPLGALASLVNAGVVGADEDTKATLSAVKPATTADALEQYRQAKQKVRAEKADSVLTAPEDDVKAVFEELVAGFDAADTQPPKPEPVPARPVEQAGATLADRKALVAGIVTQAGPGGIMRADIIAAVKTAGLNVTDQTVSEWLSAAETDGLIRNAGKTGGKKGLWLPGQAA